MKLYPILRFREKVHFLYKLSCAKSPISKLHEYHICGGLKVCIRGLIQWK